jgi:hypothetical protein
LKNKKQLQKIIVCDIILKSDFARVFQLFLAFPRQLMKNIKAGGPLPIFGYERLNILGGNKYGRIKSNLSRQLKNRTACN